MARRRFDEVPWRTTVLLRASASFHHLMPTMKTDTNMQLAYLVGPVKT
jgi:hypothetical protein